MRSKGNKGNQEQMSIVRVRSHVATGSPSRVALPDSFGIILTGEIIIPSRSREGEMVWLCLRYYFWVFSIDRIGKNVHHRFRGGALRALPDTG